MNLVNPVGKFYFVKIVLQIYLWFIISNENLCQG